MTKSVATQKPIKPKAVNGSESDRWVSQMRKGLLELLVLRILKSKETYGYSILSKLEEYEGLTVTESTLYLLLGRLTKEGLLTARQVKSTEGPPRRYYSLTKTGRGRLAKMTIYWKGLTASVNEILNGT